MNEIKFDAVFYINVKFL